MMVATSAAIFSIPAYAVVNFQTGTGKHEKLIHLVTNGTDDGVVFTKQGSSSSVPDPGSDSKAGTPGSGGCLWTCSGSDSKINFPSSGSSSLPGGGPLGVPESSTWMMMIMGFFSIGAIRYRALRRARKVELAQDQDQA